MTYGFLPAAERLGLEVSLLTDQPEAHVRALTRAADVAAGWPAGTGPAGERALTSGAPGIERLLAGGTPGVVPCDVHDTRALIGRIAGLPAIRLLVKDFAGALIHHARLTGALGGAGPEAGGFGDQRLLAGSDDELADVFITITVHLCAGALAFGLARRGHAPLGELTLATGTVNAEFVSQVRDGHAAFAAILQALAEKSAGDDRGAAGRIGAYLDSEQALVAGHRFHPSPKIRQGRRGTGCGTRRRPGRGSRCGSWPCARRRWRRKATFPGTVLLGEPGYRTAALACRDASEGLAVIVREGVRSRIAPDVTPLLAASLTEPAGGLFDGRDGDWLLAWWQAYVRVAYCLLVNHLAEVSAAIADRCAPAADCERELWRQARQVLTEAAAEHGWPPELRPNGAG